MSRPIRVTHVLEATEGGARRWLESVVGGLNPREVRNSCICSFRREPDFRSAAEEMRAHGVPVWEVDMQRSIQPLADVRALRQIVRILKDSPCDVIHGHCAKGGMLARLAARMTGIPCVYSPHAFPYLCGGAAGRVYRALERWAISKTDALMAVSEAEAEEALSLGYPDERIHTVANGVECAAESAPRSIATRHPWVGTLSALRPQKDPLVFVEACARIHRVKPEIGFRLCGAGPLEATVRRQVARLSLSDCLEMPGRVTPGAAALKAWSVFVLSSRYEGLSMALLEAMAAGVPVVVTGVAGNAEVVLHEKTGLVVPPADPGRLAAAVLRLLDEPDLGQRLAAAARERVRERFSLHRQLQGLTHLYQSVVENHRK